MCERLTERWGSPVIVSRGTVHRAAELPGFVAVEGGRLVGAALVSWTDRECEIVSLDSWMSGLAVGTALVDAVLREAERTRVRRVWLVTTNDNTRALRFHQKVGFRLVALHADAIARSRMLKPEIPDVGCDGIPIRDEIELEIRLDARLPRARAERPPTS